MDKDNSSPNAKQQISEKIKEVSNILVTVSKNPTVDELSAALALTLILNKLDKHATAVFSGTIPPAIEFLEPDKTLENNVDSLRDFIIAIDKEKADRLRYKVEGDIVRIFITPYRTHISQEDLEFTHGDFNVELVIALGVENQDVLDEAIVAHGKILHDAVVATINAQNKTSTLGSIDWRDETASSLCEMLVALGESLKSGLLDEQIATSLLTGVVAATDRFSNEQTSSKAMTIAAQLMAAGANQQLIASKLESADEISVSKPDQAKDSSTLKIEKEEPNDKSKKKQAKNENSLGQIKIDHGARVEAEPVDPQTQPETIEEHDKTNKQNAGEEALDVALEKLGVMPKDETVADLQTEIESVSEDTTQPKRSPLISHSRPSGAWSESNLEEPSMGGAINATAQGVAEEKRSEEGLARNKTILSHGGTASPKGKDVSPQDTSNTLADIETDIGVHQESSAQQPSPTDLPSVPPPPLPDFANLPPLLPEAEPAVEPPSTATTPIPPPASATTTPPVAPGQFKIPNQR